MTAPSREQAQRALRDFAYRAQHSKTRRAVLGGIDPATGAQVLNAPGRPGWVIVRVLEGDTVTQTVALNMSVKSVYGLPVLVRPNEEGLLTVFGVREGELTNQLGTSAQALAVPDVVSLGLITERRFEPGLVQAKLVSGAYTLSVWINSFVYTSADGALAEWPGGWLDLTSHIPGAGLRRWVLVGIDPTTRTATAIDGATFGTASTLGMTQLAAIDPAGILTLAGVNLAYGQTEIREEHIIDARIFPTAAGASAAFITLTDTPATYASHAGHLVVVNAAESGLEFVEAAGAGPFDVDAPPDSPSAYDDEFDDASVAVAWSELDPDSYQTVAEADGVLTLTNDATDTAPDVPTMLVRDVPVGDWAAATHVTTDATTNNILAGIGVTFPTAGNYVYLELVDQVSEKVLFLWLDAGGTKTFEASSALTVTDGCYLRLRYDDSESLMVGEYSLDGLAWSSVEMDISALAEAPESFGLCIRPWGNDTDVEAEFAFFRVVEAFGASTDPILGDYGAPLALDAGQVGYTPTTGADWTDPDPTTVQGALDALAARGGGALADHDHSGDAGDGGAFDAANLASGAATDGHVLTADGSGGAAWEAPPAGGAVDSDDVTYTPTTLTDWDSDADPGDVEQALDQLAARVDDLEAASGGGAPTIATAYASAGDAHTNNTTWEDINSMSVSVTPAAANAVLLCTFTCTIKMDDTSWEHFKFRFDLDGASQSEAWRSEKDQNAVTSHELLITVHSVFTGVSAAAHTIKAQWYTASNLNVTINERRLTVLVGAA